MAFPPWIPVVVTVSTIAVLALAAFLVPHPNWDQDVSVAFIGNSFLFYNDLPRMMEALSDGHIDQNSCLRPGASFATILVRGNGMYKRFHTNNSILEEGTDEIIYDYGACTIHQLLFGYYASNNDYSTFVYDYNEDDDDDGINDDDAAYGNDDDANNDDDDDDAIDANNNNAYLSDANNPCHESEFYMNYLQDYYSHEDNIPNWDFVVMDDASRSPGVEWVRNSKLELLQSTYLPWFQEMESAIPVFIQTHAYWNEEKNMTGLYDIPTFTYQTYEGYRQYAELMEEGLPESRKPRMALVGNAFLIIWEENQTLWQKLYHSDGIHPSPLGTYLQGCILYCTLFGRMPLKKIAIRDDMSSLWSRARRMQPPKLDPNPFPTRQEAEYLFHMAERVTLYGHTPKVFENLQH